MKNAYLIKLLLFAVFGLCSLPLLAGVNRLALVIGNADYEVGRLANPVNDAKAIDAKLTSLGFTVQRVENLKKADIDRTLNGFISRVQPGDEVVVFYAGHGMQINGVNYFQAVDANIEIEDEVARNSIDLSLLLVKLDATKAAVKLLFLDACRRNPFHQKMRFASRNIPRGLIAVNEQPEGTVIQFATDAGGEAADGGESGNGLYTSALLRYIGVPGMTIESMIKNVRKTVSAAPRIPGKPPQVPWAHSNLVGEFYFKSAPLGLPAEQIEQQAWDEAQTVNSAASYDAYLLGYPQGRFAGLARVKRAKFAAPLPIPSVTPPVVANTPVKDCDFCPEMVMIPAGQFEMGSNTGKDHEKPMHTVKVGAFMLSKYEVTQGQWKAVMGNNPSEFKNCGDTCPVENVSWNDAQAYVQKLNARTGGKYRLPSEAEWEYAARAGGTGKWSFGDDETQLGKYAWYDANSGSKTHPVGTKLANKFGLHDMHGNVYEWVEDCYYGNYKGAPQDGSAWTKDCKEGGLRALRGGGWYFLAEVARSAGRFYGEPGGRGGYAGFRLAFRSSGFADQ